MEETTPENQDIETESGCAYLGKESFSSLLYFVDNRKLAEFVFENTPYEKYDELLASEFGWGLFATFSVCNEGYYNLIKVNNTYEYSETFLTLLLNSDYMTQEKFNYGMKEGWTCLHSVDMFDCRLVPLFFTSKFMTKELFDTRDGRGETFLYNFIMHHVRKNDKSGLDKVLASEFLTEETIYNLNKRGNTLFKIFQRYNDEELNEYARHFLSRCDRDHLLSIVTDEEESEFIQSL